MTEKYLGSTDCNTETVEEETPKLNKINQGLMKTVRMNWNTTPGLKILIPLADYSTLKKGHLIFEENG